uniref:Uncharacterized protein n=1 Tax=Romanomermis culicivorax TaxID=13658 RepID=A0A915KU63_ROMCU
MELNGNRKPLMIRIYLKLWIINYNPLDFGKDNLGGFSYYCQVYLISNEPLQCKTQDVKDDKIEKNYDK